MFQNKKNYLLLHILLVLYSIGGICSKKAAAVTFFSIKFFFYYILLLLILAVYAFGWQQIIKVLPLSMAFANKSITVIWSLFWGVLLFNENITFEKLLGISFIVIGIILFTYEEKRVENEQ